MTAKEDGVGAVELTKDALGPFLDRAKAAAAIGLLRELAGKITIVNNSEAFDCNNGPTVCSPQIRLMMAAYQFCGQEPVEGLVHVVCSPQDSGKSVAARYLLHGDHLFRPVRGLMISAAGIEDYAKHFCLGYLGSKGKSGALAANVLVSAVAAADKTPRKVAAKAPQTAGYWNQEYKSFNASEAISLTGGAHTFRTNLTLAFRNPPVLVIDDFNVESNANKEFVEHLYAIAAQSRITVFLLTKNKKWATTLVKLNGGTKIVPLRGNVDNKWGVDEAFMGEPKWNDMQWEVSCLQDLVRAGCNKVGIRAEDLITTTMLPKLAKRKLKHQAGGAVVFTDTSTSGDWDGYKKMVMGLVLSGGCAVAAAVALLSFQKRLKV